MDEQRVRGFALRAVIVEEGTQSLDQRPVVLRIVVLQGACHPVHELLQIRALTGTADQ
jgi:hypothetical protein